MVREDGGSNHLRGDYSEEPLETAAWQRGLGEGLRRAATTGAALEILRRRLPYLSSRLGRFCRDLQNAPSWHEEKFA